MHSVPKPSLSELEIKNKFEILKTQVEEFIAKINSSGQSNGNLKILKMKSQRLDRQAASLREDICQLTDFIPPKSGEMYRIYYFCGNLKDRLWEATEPLIE